MFHPTKAGLYFLIYCRGYYDISTNDLFQALCIHIIIPITNMAEGNNTIRLLFEYHPNQLISVVFRAYPAVLPIIL